MLPKPRDVSNDPMGPNQEAWAKFLFKQIMKLENTHL